ncbi:MAG: AAA family ATPase [Candidatus Bathyarchaeota archaeon]|nr:AAA family ATPase [Candidatus Bathyarchaeum sp.]
MKIAVSGKGGVGKTLVSGTLSGYFAQKGFKVMAIDADPSPNLALTLGIPVEEANKIVPISENSELLESKTKTDYPGVFKLHFTVDDIVEQNGMKSPYGVNLLVMGTIKSAGGGCACGANAVIRELLRHLIVDRDEIVIVDMEAGVEHMGRGTASHVDVMLVVVDSSRKSLEIAKKISGFAHDAGIKNVFVVGNRVRDSEETELITDFTEKNGLSLLALIPYDDTVIKADRVGEAPLKYAQTSEGVKAIQVIGEKLLQDRA